MNAEQNTHSALADSLRDFGDIKVWSMLVTILGDLASEEGQSLSGPVLSALTSRIGIRPEALRVALHRLRKDGWVLSEKAGRISHYRLSALGRRETTQARARVYGPGAEPPETCYVVHLPRGGTSEPAPGSVRLDRQTWLSDRAPASGPDRLVSVLHSVPLPKWACEAILPPELTAAYGALEQILTTPPACASEPAEAADRLVLRMLILHNWRRLVLRHAALAGGLMPANWPGHRCRHAVLDWLARLPRTDLDQLAAGG